MNLELAIRTMRIKHLRVWPVVDDGNLLGVLTTRHIAGDQETR